VLSVEISQYEVRPDTSLRGFEVSDDEWQLDPEVYREFVESVTGMDVSDELSASQCYRIRNRLEAFIEERRRHDEWGERLAEDHPAIESLDEIVELAAFFRELYDHRVETNTV
jgi:hypothetical protein